MVHQVFPVLKEKLENLASKDPLEQVYHQLI